jgi:hypothetical protein
MAKSSAGATSRTIFRDENLRFNSEEESSSSFLSFFSSEDKEEEEDFPLFFLSPPNKASFAAENIVL